MADGKMSALDRELMPVDGAVKLHASDVAVLNAVQFVTDRDGRATVRTVAAATGTSVSPVFKHLRYLRSLGLVTWDPVRNGTLRLTVERVFTPAEQSQLVDVL